jgi:hypothetical protein
MMLPSGVKQRGHSSVAAPLCMTRGGGADVVVDDVVNILFNFKTLPPKMIHSFL